MFTSEDKVKEILSELTSLALSTSKSRRPGCFFFLFVHSEWPEAVTLATQLDFYRGNSGKEKTSFLFQKYSTIA